MSFINVPDKAGCAKLLQHAAREGDLKEVKRLVATGVDVKCFSNRRLASRTALHFASERGHFDVVRFLLDHGAVIDASDRDGWTPLLLASMYEHVSVVELLLFRGADFRQENLECFTALQLAAMHDCIEATEILLVFGAELEVRGAYGHTALMSSVGATAAKTIRLLLDLNADTTKSDRIGWDISQTRYPAMRQLLFDHSKKSEQEREQTRIETINQIRNKVGARLMKYAHREIFDICLAMCKLELPSYVLLSIIDWLPHYDKLSHTKKIRLIESVRVSVRQVNME